MKRNVFTLLAVLFMLGSLQLNAQMQIPNGDFESWLNPDSATGWNGVDFLGICNVHQSTDCHGGTYAAQLLTQDTATFIIPGLITLGKLNILAMMVEGGVPCTDKPDEMRGFFKYAPQGGDTLNAVVYFWVTDTSNNKDTVGMGTFDTAASVNTYAPFRVIIEWDTTFTGDPDSMNIVLTNSGFKPHDGTLAWYDDLSFYYDNTGLSQPIVDYFNHVFPNPCQGQLNVHTTKGTGISIIDITGNIIYQTIATNDLVHIDLSGKATGLYFLKQQNANGIHTSKVILR